MTGFLSLIREPFRDFVDGIRAFAPNVLAMLTLFVLGGVTARIIYRVVRRLLVAMHFDSWCDRLGFTAMMRRGDLWTRPSEALSKVLFWFLITLTVMIGLNAVNVPAIDGLVAEFFLYLPRVLSAVLILVVGHLLAGVLSRTVLIALVNGGQTHARALAEVVRLLIVVLVLAMALEQLHLAPTIVVAAFSVIFGGIVIALAIAFGVGGIDAARRVIETATAKRAAEGDKAAEEHQLDHL